MNNENDTRTQLFNQLLDSLNDGFCLMEEYDAVPHDYGAAVLYQSESQIIHLVGHQPGITASEIATIFRKTPSACSQLIRKLRKKDWLFQMRNRKNNREYQLYLTDEGKLIYEDHDRFEKRCLERSFSNLSDFSDDDFKTYIAIQNKLNETFALDVEESKTTPLLQSDTSSSPKAKGRKKED